MNKGVIELNLSGLAYIVKPKKLIFQSFGDRYEWAYFRLETDKLRPYFSSDDAKSILEEEKSLSEGARQVAEEITEIEPNHYAKYDVWDRGTIYDYETDQEVPLPDTARPVTRYFQGAFVIFAKRSPYNLNGGTYDGRHNSGSDEEFRFYIDQVIKKFYSHRSLESSNLLRDE